jgi:outer membrane protein assembly factor BamB
MRQLACALLTVVMPASIVPAQTVNWPQFRGAHSDGLAEGDTLPDTWSTTENVVWKADVPGWGWSSPVIWGDRLFVTSAVSEHEREELVVGGYPGGHVHPTDIHRWMTYCLDIDTGSILWEREAHRGVPPEERHPKNSYANATPSTDGQRVYVHFDNIGLVCYSLDGQELWRQGWGSFPMRGGWGPGASPVLHGDRIYVVNDNERESFMVALDKATGEQVWRVERQEQSNWERPKNNFHFRRDMIP